MPAQPPLKLTPTSGTTGELREFAAGDFLGIAAGGTGVSAGTVADVRTALGLGSAAVAPILGTVSQSGGVPTGAIVQRGSNANGEFVRFADGTQLCWKPIVIPTNTLLATITNGSVGFYSNAWPATFIANTEFAVPQVYKHDGSLYAGDIVASVDSTRNGTDFTLGVSVKRSSNVTTTGATYILVLGAGRWF